MSRAAFISMAYRATTLRQPRFERLSLCVSPQKGESGPIAPAS
jgi:hypothetical protein